MTFSVQETDRLDRLLAVVAEAEIMSRFNRLQAGEVRAKSSATDLVTDADEAAEEAIAAALRETYPGAAILGEEAATRDPGLLDTIGNAPLAFIVDPVDGTRNFVAGLPVFAVMAAVSVHGDVVAGVIHDPVSRMSAIAVRGQGAWLKQADGSTRSLRVAAPVPVNEMEAIVAVGFLGEPLRSVVARNMSKLGSTAALRCAAHEYRLAAGGHCHLLMYNKLMPWDHAAGWLLHREAGGYSAHYDGTPYRPTQRTGGLLYAPDEASWHRARDALLT